MLREHEKVACLSAVPEARVPLCKFKYDGVDIDMVYSQVQHDSLYRANFQLSDMNNLRNMEKQSVDSLNGSRVAEALLKLVPDKNAFIEALKCIKLWAKRRGIYSNVMGYLGGISWAILVARVCQLYPNQNYGCIVVRFFRFYDIWDFGAEHPILLTKTEQNEELGFESWDPAMPQAQQARMAIITPCYPAINSTFRCTASNYQILKDEFKRANRLATPGSQNVVVDEKKWREILQQKDFFFEHDHYILVRARCTSPEMVDMQRQWKGFIEAKIRTLILGMETVAGITVIPWPDHNSRTGRDRKLKKDYVEDVFFIGINIDPDATTLKFNFAQPIRVFISQVDNNPLAQSSPHLTLIIEHKKAHKLPDFCFDPNDPRRPTKKKRAKRKRAANAIDAPDQEIPSDEPKAVTPPSSSATSKSPSTASTGAPTPSSTLASSSSVSKEGTPSLNPNVSDRKRKRLSDDASIATNSSPEAGPQNPRKRRRTSRPNLPDDTDDPRLRIALIKWRKCLEKPSAEGFLDKLNRLTEELLAASGDLETGFRDLLPGFGWQHLTNSFNGQPTETQRNNLWKAAKKLFSYPDHSSGSELGSSPENSSAPLSASHVNTLRGSTEPPDLDLGDSSVDKTKRSRFISKDSVYSRSGRTTGGIELSVSSRSTRRPGALKKRKRRRNKSKRLITISS